MIEKFEYKFVNFDSLTELILKGVSEVVVGKEKNGRPHAVWFVLADRRAIKITSIVSSVVDSWDEMGSLVFELMDECGIHQNTTVLNHDWLDIRSIKKMVFKDDMVYAESGLVLENIKGEEIVVVSSSFPFSVEISSEIHSVGFEPYCDLDKYQKEIIWQE